MFAPIGSKLIHLDEVDSTNNFAAKLVLEGNGTHGTVILADSQTSGRGQRMAVWESMAGENMLFSFILIPDNLSVANQFELSQVVALSLVSFLRKFGIPALIKWPNDILVNRKKIAGVLIENQLQGKKINLSVVGIGLNVNQFDFGVMNATSMRNQTGQFYLVNELIFSFISSFNELIELSKNVQQLQQNYLDNLFGYRTVSRFSDETGEFEGIIEDVDPNGKLIVSKNSEIKKYDLKEISLLLV